MEEKLAECRPLSIVLTRLQPSEINKWRHRKPPKRRRAPWQKGIVKKYRAKKKLARGREASESSSLLDDHSDTNSSRSAAVTSASVPPEPEKVVAEEPLDPPDDVTPEEPKASTTEEDVTDALPLWKYKRKRKRSVSSTRGSDECISKKAAGDKDTTAPEIRLNVVEESQPVSVENNVDTDIENFEEAASLIMDSCDSPVKSIDTEPEPEPEPEPEQEQRAEDAEGNRERIEQSVTSDSPESKDYFTPDEIIIEEEFHELKESLETSDSHYVNINAISDEEDSDVDPEDRLMDLCLGQDAKVLVTRLEDVAQALERTNVPQDVAKLTPEDLSIIRNFRSALNASDDASYRLVFSPDTEPTEATETEESSDESDEASGESEEPSGESEEPSGESEEPSGESEGPGVESDSDDSINFLPRLRPRTRRRIISDGSDSSETDPMDLLPVKPRPPKAKTPEGPQVIASSPRSALTSQRSVDPPRVDPVNEQFENSIEESSTLSCSVCNETFDSSADQLKHVCSSPEKKTKRSHKGKKDRRIRPKLSEPQCNVCSQRFESHEELSDHIYKHTERELQDAYKAARQQNRSEEDVEVISNADDPPEEPERAEQTAEPGVAMMIKEKSPKKLRKKSVPVSICPCHTNDLEPTDLTVQIEMILFCEICKVLFRRHECFETHYRSNAKCAEDRRRGRVPRLFCSTCRVVLNTLSDMRRHLEEHANINRHGTVTFVCNICRVVFFGVGTVFCTHWFNHEKDPMFVASRWSFPKLCVTNRGRNPQGTTPGEQFLFVAEYVCRFCKLQFSSDGELSNHITRDCQAEQRPSLPQSSNANSKPKAPEPPPPAPPAKPPTPPVAPVPPQRPRAAAARPPVVTARPPVVAARPPVVGARPPVVSARPPGPARKNAYLRSWVCDICDKGFDTWDLIERHAVIHFTDAKPADYVNRSVKTFKCTACPREFNLLEPLGRHGLTHDCIRYHCTTCKDNYYTFAAFSRHITVLCRSHSPSCRLLFGTRNVCRICGTVRADAKALIQHQIDKHRINVEAPSNTVVSPASRPPNENDRTAVNQICPVAPVTSQASEPPPLVVSLQPSAEAPQASNSYIINIAIPTTQVAEKPPSPPKVVRALEDPTVQVVLRQPTPSEPNVSASLVTNTSPSHGRTSAVASTFTLTMSDTTSTGGRITATEPAPLPADRISDADIAAVLQDLVPIDEDPCINNADKAASQGSSQPAPITPIAANRTLLEVLLESNSAASSDDIQIIEVSKGAKEMSMNSPKKLSPVPLVDSDVEVLSDTSGKAKVQKEPGKPDTDESSDSSGEVRLVKNPLSKPQGFLRVKNLADLQEGGNDQSLLKTGKSLTEHLIAHSRLAKSPTKIAGPSGSHVPSASNSPHVPGKRTLPMIPQRAVGGDARRANALPSNPPPKPMNRVTPIPTNTVSPNVSRPAAPQAPDNAESSNSADNRQMTPSKYTCPLCPQFDYPTLNDFVNHLYQHPNMPSSVQDLVHYLRNKSDGTPQQKQQSQPTYKCLVCSAYETDSAVEFQKHMATHNPQCLTSPNPVAYSQQMEYAPVYMQYSYQVQPPSQSVQQIALSSNGMSPVQIYTCHICTTFHVTSCEELQKHIQTAHSIISTAIYACLNCPQTPTFPNQQMLKHHQDTHHPYVCSICMQRFNSTYDLNAHCDVNHKGQYGA